MTGVTVLAVLALGLCVQVSFAEPVKVLTPNATLDHQCKTKSSSKKNSTTAPMPYEDCDPQKYIMCEDGIADTIGDCGIKMRFEESTGWCIPWREVPMPTGCPENRRIPTFCGQYGASKIALPHSCSYYTECVQSRLFFRACPAMSYFIPSTSDCMSYMEPYVDDIPQDEKEACDKLQAAETSTTPKTKN